MTTNDEIEAVNNAIDRDWDNFIANLPPNWELVHCKLPATPYPKYSLPDCEKFGVLKVGSWSKRENSALNLSGKTWPKFIDVAEAVAYVEAEVKASRKKKGNNQ